MKKVFIIAEAGVNHNGVMANAMKLIDVACTAGADAVKFQTFKAGDVMTASAPKAPYQIKNVGKEVSQLDMVKKLELNEEQHLQLINYCRKKGIMFLSTPFDCSSIDLLSRLGLNIFKIPSGEITNVPYLERIGRLKKSIILSTGMADLNEIKAAVKILTRQGTLKSSITLLHCHTDYPTDMADVNLRAINTLKTALHIPVGYSDHTLGIEVPIAAVALGATVIEKHFTLDRKLEGPDHKASLEPKELAFMVQSIRNIEKALGNGIKKPSSKEKANKLIVRKSIVALCDIRKGERFSERNLTVKRPGTGLSPMEWHRVLGKAAKQDFKRDSLIKL